MTDWIERKAAMDALKNAALPFGYDKAVAAIRALPTAQVGVAEALGAVVKPLVWDDHSKADNYRIVSSQGEGPKGYFLARGNKIIGWFDTESEAHPIAQADYTARIIAALEPPTHAAQLAAALALPEVAAMRTALLEAVTILNAHISASRDVELLRRIDAALEARHDPA